MPNMLPWNTTGTVKLLQLHFIIYQTMNKIKGSYNEKCHASLMRGNGMQQWPISS